MSLLKKTKNKKQRVGSLKTQMLMGSNLHDYGNKKDNKI
jgi:hypothetical protein